MDKYKKIVKVRNHLREVSVESDSISETDLPFKKKRKQKDLSKESIFNKTENSTSVVQHDNITEKNTKKTKLRKVLITNPSFGNISSKESDNKNESEIWQELKNLLENLQHRVDNSYILLEKILRELQSNKKNRKIAGGPDNSSFKSESSDDDSEKQSLTSSENERTRLQHSTKINNIEDNISSVVSHEIKCVSPELQISNKDMIIAEPLTDDLIQLNKLLQKGIPFERRRQIINHIKLIRFQSVSEVKLMKSELKKQLSNSVEDVIGFPGSNLQSVNGYGLNDKLLE